MVTEAELLTAVDTAFTDTAQGMVAWPAPHPDRRPLDEEYSRVTDPAKSRIIGARAEAWLVALTDLGLAVAERDATVRWTESPGTVITGVDRLMPHAAGPVPLVIARSRIEDVDDDGVTLGAGDPAICAAVVPFCGCDACDDGAQPELDDLDAAILAVVRGAFRRLSQGDRVITVTGEGSMSSAGVFGDELLAVLDDPTGWDEVSGSSWFGPE